MRVLLACLTAVLAAGNACAAERRYHPGE